MPKGVHIKDHLEDPDFKILYTTLKHSNLKDTDFGEVAVEMGCKDAAFARALYNRTMKAQGKGSNTPKKSPAAGKNQTPKKSAKGDSDGGNGGDGGSGGGDDGIKDDVKTDATEGSAKKRKISATASSEATTEKLDEEAAEVKEEDEMKQESGTEVEDGE